MTNYRLGGKYTVNILNFGKNFNRKYKSAAMAVKLNLESIKEIGAIIKFHRKLAGLSRIDLANIAGVGKTVVYDIENGKETVRLNTLFRILGVLNISISLESPLMDQYKADDDAKS